MKAVGLISWPSAKGYGLRAAGYGLQATGYWRATTIWASFVAVTGYGPCQMPRHR
jgi:hypothetical protein